MPTLSNVVPKEWKSPEFLWGDEIEVGVFNRDSTGRYDLSLRAPEILQVLVAEQKSGQKRDCDFQPEYGSWMVDNDLKLRFS